MNAKAENIKTDFYSTLINRIIVYGIILVQGILLSRWLGPHGKGIQAKLLASLQLITTFMEIGLSNALTFFVASKKLEIKHAYAISAQFLSICIIILLFFSYLSKSGTLFDLFYPIELKDTIFIFYLSCMALIEIIRFQIVSIVSSQKFFKKLNNLELKISLFRLCIFILLYFYLDRIDWQSKINYLLIIDLFISALGVFNYFLMAFKNIKVWPSFKLNYYQVLGDLGKFATFIYLSNVINFLFLRIDFWIVENYLGVEKLGAYSVSVSLGAGLTFIPLAMNTILLPHLVDAQPIEQNLIFAKYSRFNFSVSVILSLILLIAAPLVMPLAFGHKYDSSIKPFQILILGYLISSFKYLLGVYFKAKELLWFRVIVDVIGLVLCLVFSFVLTPYLGLIGAAIAFGLAHLVSLVILLKYLRKKSPIEAPLFWARHEDWKYFLNIDFFNKSK